jgi:hypothetical protein
MNKSGEEENTKESRLLEFQKLEAEFEKVRV